MRESEPGAVAMKSVSTADPRRRHYAGVQRIVVVIASLRAPVATAPGSDSCMQIPHSSFQLDLLPKSSAAERCIPLVRQCVKAMILRDGHIVSRESRAGRTLEFGDRFVQIGLGLQLGAPSY